MSLHYIVAHQCCKLNILYASSHSSWSYWLSSTSSSTVITIALVHACLVCHYWALVSAIELKYSLGAVKHDQ